MKQRYVLVTWPESQQFMDHERFNECLFVQDIEVIQKWVLQHT